MKSPVYFLIVCILILSHSLQASDFKVAERDSGNSIEVFGTFDREVLVPSADQKFEIKKNGLLQTMEAGLPSVPVKTFLVALPSGRNFQKAKFEVTGTRAYSGQIVTSAAQMPISWIGNAPKDLKHEAAPQYDSQYPAQKYTVSKQVLHGVTVLVVNVYPIREIDHKSIEAFSQFKLTLSTSRSSEAPVKLFSHQAKELKNLVSNPETISAYASREEATNDYLILATPKVIGFTGANGLEDLQKSLTEKGLKSKVVSLAKIDEAAGTDRVEKIRNFIRDEYKTTGIQYVLLVGKSVKSSSEPFFPARPLWTKIKAYFGYWTTLEENIPADLYYSNLDGTFNGNGNDKWGETTDGENGGDVDFLPEVTVGRVVVETQAQLQNFVRKTLYTKSHKLSQETALLGEELFKELNLYGDDYMNQLVGECSDHNFTTTGYSNDWKLTKFYDKASKWSGKDAQKAISQNPISMVNHLGHSNQSTNMKLSSSNISAFTNANPFVYYTQGCLAAKFTVGSFVDKMVTATNAAVSAIGNSSYGLAPEDPDPNSTKTPGGSQMLHRQFIHSIFTNHLTQLGKAHQASKVAFVGMKDIQEVRWINWTAHYFGDPSLELSF